MQVAKEEMLLKNSVWKLLIENLLLLQYYT